MSIDLLDSDSLTYLLSFLSTSQLFKIEPVNKKWQKCIRKLLERRITELRVVNQLLYGNPFHRRIKSDKYSSGYTYDFIIYHINIKMVKSILSRCQSVKYLNLGSCKII